MSLSSSCLAVVGKIKSQNSARACLVGILEPLHWVNCPRLPAAEGSRREKTDRRPDLDFDGGCQARNKAKFTVFETSQMMNPTTPTTLRSKLGDYSAESQHGGHSSGHKARVDYSLHIQHADRSGEVEAVFDRVR